MTRAYILVHTEAGRAGAVALAIRAMAQVRQADCIAGAYDLMVVAESEHLHDLREAVLEPIRRMSGVRAAVVCPVDRHERMWDIGTVPADLEVFHHQPSVVP